MYKLSIILLCLLLYYSFTLTRMQLTHLVSCMCSWVGILPVVQEDYWNESLECKQWLAPQIWILGENHVWGVCGFYFQAIYSARIFLSEQTMQLYSHLWRWSSHIPFTVVCNFFSIGFVKSIDNVIQARGVFAQSRDKSPVKSTKSYS